MVSNTGLTVDALKYINGLPTKTQKTSISQDVSSAVSGMPVAAGFEALTNINGYTRKLANAVDVYNFSGTADELAAGTKKAGGIFKFLAHPIKTTKALFSGTKAYSAEAKAIIGKGSTNTNNYEIFKAIKNLDKKAVENAATLSKDNLQAIKKSQETLKGLIGNTDKTAVRAAIDSADDAASAMIKTTTKKPGIIKRAASAAGSAIKNTKVYEKFATTGIGSKIIEKAGKFGKLAKGSGAGFMAVIEGGLELFTEVIPAFKNGGAKSGIKQTGKSAVKVGASVGGWVAGAAAGAKIGAVIGSVFPGAGTVIGGVLGFAGGLLGSALFSGVAKKITGKSENEKLQEQQLEQQAALIASDTQAVNELNSAVASQIQSDIQNGTVTEDTQKMIEYMNANGFSDSAVGTAGNETTFGSLTSPAATTATSTNVPYPIATNADGSFDFSVPQSAQTAVNTTGTTNPYAYQDPLLA